MIVHTELELLDTVLIGAYCQLKTISSSEDGKSTSITSCKELLSEWYEGSSTVADTDEVKNTKVKQNNVNNRMYTIFQDIFLIETDSSKCKTIPPSQKRKKAGPILSDPVGFRRHRAGTRTQ